MRAKNDQKVGYKNPPRRTRFRAGVSGNPKGRPKGSLNTTTVLRRILNQRIQVRIGGQLRRLTRWEAMVMTAANKALQGDLKAFQLLMAALPEDSTATAPRSGVLAVPGTPSLAAWLTAQGVAENDDENR